MSACKYEFGTNPEMDFIVRAVGPEIGVRLFMKHQMKNKDLTLYDFLQQDYIDQVNKYDSLSENERRKRINNTGYQSSKDIEKLRDKALENFLEVSPIKMEFGAFQYIIYKPINYSDRIKNFYNREAERERSELDKTANVKELEGEILPLDSPIRLVHKKANPRDYRNHKYSRVFQKLENKIKDLELDLAKAKDKTDKETISKTIDNTKDTLESLRDKASIENIITLAKEDLDNVQEILKEDEVSDKDLLNVKRSIDFWISTDILNSLFDRDDMEGEGSLAFQTYNQEKSRAHTLNSLWMNKMYDTVAKTIKEQSGKNYSDIELDKMMKVLKEIDFAQAQFRGINTVDNTMVQIADKMIKAANEVATMEAIEISKEVDDLIKPIRSKVGKNFELLNQKDSKGRYTKNLVHRFSSRFFEEAKKFKPKDWRKRDQILRYKKFKKENMIMFDFRKLFYSQFKEITNQDFTFTQEELDNHSNELKRHLGEQGYNYYLNKAQKKFNDYKLRYQAKKEEFQEENKYTNDEGEEKIDTSIVDTALAIWESQYSPSNYYTDTYEDTKIFNKNLRFQGWEYIIEVPRRYFSSGTQTNYYDSQFTQIESDKDLKTFYDYLMDKLEEFKSYYSKDITDGLQSNFIPEIPRTMLENLLNMKGIGSTLYDTMINSLTKEDLYQRYIDETGRERRSLPIYMLNKESTQLTDSEVTLLKVEARQKYTEGSKQYNEYLDDLISKEKEKKLDAKSFDLGTILKAFALTSLTYKHKSQIEDSIKLIDIAVKEAAEAVLNPDNTIKDDKYGTKSNKEGLKQLTSSWNYMMDTMYGMSRGDVKLSNKKLYNYNEKKAKKLIAEEIKKTKLALKQGTITKPIHDKTLEKLNSDLDKLGKHIDKWAWLDIVNKYIHVKGLGWNPFSGLTNLGVALTSNFGYAASSQDFTDKEVVWAYGKMINNVAKLGKAQTPEGKKISALMSKFDIMKDIREGIYGNNLVKKFENLGPLRYLMPYELTQRVEFINQGVTFLAMMKNTKITDLKGKERSLYEAFNSEGNWNKEEFGENKDWDNIQGKKRLDFKLKVERVKEIVHGNYNPNSPTLIKKTAFGRALMIFRSWMPEGFASRFEKEKQDEILDRTIKGRYRSFLGSKDNSGDPVKFFSKDMQVNILKELGRQLTLGYTNKDSFEDFSSVDKANMRRNIREIILYLNLFALGHLLSFMKGDDEDEEERSLTSLYALNYMLNTTNRLQTDLTFYTNPISFEQISKNALPAFQLTIDAANFAKASKRALDGRDGDNGAATLEQRTWELFPGARMYYTTKRLMEKEF